MKCNLKIMLVITCLAQLILSCAKKHDLEIHTNYCDYIDKQEIPKLSSVLNPVIFENKGKTGVYVMEEGDESMIARAWMCNSAEKTIDVQYFIFSTDNVGLIAVDHLLRAAERGVKVRILVDDFMVEADEKDMFLLNKHPNIHVKVYNPNANVGKSIIEIGGEILRGFGDFNQRMHNKVFNVDGKAVITGGRNIADEYFDYDHEYNFRDRDVLLIGEVVKSISSSYDLFWKDSLSVNINSLIDTSKVEEKEKSFYKRVHEYACNPENYWPQVREKMFLVPQAFKNIQKNGYLYWLTNVTYVSDKPGKNNSENKLAGGGVTTDTLVSLMKKAKKEILIQTPYLILDKEGIELFRSLVNNGVEIAVLTNSLASTDNLEAFNGYYRDREKLLELGVHIYEFKPDAEVRKRVMTSGLQKKIDYTPIFGLHAKSMVIDGEITVIGTFNLDPRSVNLNTECITIIRDKTLSNMVKSTFEIDFKEENSWKVTNEFNPDSEAGYYKGLKMKSRWFVPKSIL